jgi:hypothetical protein
MPIYIRDLIIFSHIGCCGTCIQSRSTCNVACSQPADCRVDSGVDVLGSVGSDGLCRLKDTCRCCKASGCCFRQLS